MEHRARLDRAQVEVAECRKQVEDLKYMVVEKERQGYDLQDRLQKDRGVLDEQLFVENGLREQYAVEVGAVNDARLKVSEYQKESELARGQRSRLLNNVDKLRNQLDAKEVFKTKAGGEIGRLDYELEEVLAKMAIIERQIDKSEFEIRSKKKQLFNIESEIDSLKVDYGEQLQEVEALKTDIAVLSKDSNAVAAVVRNQEIADAELIAKLRTLDKEIEMKEAEMVDIKKDLAVMKEDNTFMMHDLNRLLAEKDAVERHTSVLAGQNAELTTQLQVFVDTDLKVKEQLDRRIPVYNLYKKNEQELIHARA